MNLMRSIVLSALCCCAVTSSRTARAAPPVAVNSSKSLDSKQEKAYRTDAKKVASSYLQALSGKGDADALSYLLGGITLTAMETQIPNWSIVVEDPVRYEKLPLAAAIKAMHDVDISAQQALKQASKQSPKQSQKQNQDSSSEDEEMTLQSVDEATANRLLSSSKKALDDFNTQFPVFAYMARADKGVFWHPENPWRLLLPQLLPAGADLDTAQKSPDWGEYELIVYRFVVEEKLDQPEKSAKPADKSSATPKTRRWPLRVLRIKTPTYDSDWKILPAADWNPNY